MNRVFIDIFKGKANKDGMVIYKNIKNYFIISQIIRADYYSVN